MKKERKKKKKKKRESRAERRLIASACLSIHTRTCKTNLTGMSGQVFCERRPIQPRFQARSVFSTFKLRYFLLSQILQLYIREDQWKAIKLTEIHKSEKKLNATVVPVHEAGLINRISMYINTYISFHLHFLLSAPQKRICQYNRGKGYKVSQIVRTIRVRSDNITKVC